MRNLKYVLTATAIGGLLGAVALPSSAAPLISTGMKAMPYHAEPLVHKIHGWHCRKRYGWYHGHKYWHRHRRACYDDDYDAYDDYDGYSSYSPYYAYPFPYFSFYYDDDRHHRHHRHKKKYHKMGY